MKWLKPKVGIIPPEIYDNERDLWERPDFLTPGYAKPTASTPLPQPSHWREGPTIPELREEASEATSWGRQRTQILIGSLFGILAFAIVYQATNGSFFAASLCAALLFWSVAKSEISRRVSFASPRDENLVDDPGDENEILVEIQIVQKGMVTGSDRGVLLLDGSALIFSGHRSTFCLARSDVSNRHILSLDGDPTALWWPLHLRHPDQQVEVRLSPLVMNGMSAGQSLGKMETFIKRFNASSGKLPQNRHYPPLEQDAATRPFEVIR